MQAQLGSREGGGLRLSLAPRALLLACGDQLTHVAGPDLYLQGCCCVISLDDPFLEPPKRRVRPRFVHGVLILDLLVKFY